MDTTDLFVRTTLHILRGFELERTTDVGIDWPFDRQNPRAAAERLRNAIASGEVDASNMAVWRTLHMLRGFELQRRIGGISNFINRPRIDRYYSPDRGDQAVPPNPSAPGTSELKQPQSPHSKRRYIPKLKHPKPEKAASNRASERTRSSNRLTPSSTPPSVASHEFGKKRRWKRWREEDVERYLAKKEKQRKIAEEKEDKERRKGLAQDLETGSKSKEENEGNAGGEELAEHKSKSKSNKFKTGSKSKSKDKKHKNKHKGKPAEQDDDDDDEAQSVAETDEEDPEEEPQDTGPYKPGDPPIVQGLGHGKTRRRVKELQGHEVSEVHETEYDNWWMERDTGRMHWASWYHEVRF